MQKLRPLLQMVRGGWVRVLRALVETFHLMQTFELIDALASMRLSDAVSLTDSLLCILIGWCRGAGDGSV